MNSIPLSPLALKNFIRIILLGFLILNACKKDDNNSGAVPVNEGLKVVSSYLVNDDHIGDGFDQLPNDPSIYSYSNLYVDLVNLNDTLPTQVHTFSKVTYASTDNQGNPVRLSGLLIYPPNKIKENTPLISFNHGTELEKKYAPSQFVAGQSDITKFAEVIVAWGISALNNWIVVMPDYQGMGDDVGEVHPYCVKDMLAVATADMVEAAQNTVVQDLYPSWKGNTYIMGYSEGGFVTMAALQELEKRNADLDGAVIMEGPYDLSGAMLDMMLRDTAFPVPYFLPMLLVGYNAIYPDVFMYDEMLKSPYNVDIPKYTTGFYPAETVDSIMPPDHILKEVFTGAGLDTLINPTSKAHQTLYDNNTYIGWKPSTKTYIWHCRNDDCVPFGNFEKVKSVFGTPPNITYKEYPPINPIFNTIHETAAPIAFSEGTIWIMQQEEK